MMMARIAVCFFSLITSVAYCNEGNTAPTLAKPKTATIVKSKRKKIQLTKEQRQALTKILTSSRKEEKALLVKLREGRRQLRAMVMQPNVNNDALESKANEQGRTYAKMVLRRAKTQRAIFLLMNKNQQKALRKKLIQKK